MLEKEFKYFRDNQKELFAKYPNRFLVIRNESVVGDFDSFEEALAYATPLYDVGTFLIQKCTAGAESYTQTFHSRVVFS